MKVAGNGCRFGLDIGQKVQTWYASYAHDQGAPLRSDRDWRPKMHRLIKTRANDRGEIFYQVATAAVQEGLPRNKCEETVRLQNQRSFWDKPALHRCN